ncbi:hypothetical protein BDN70DRAFT_421607 [Pholiota conissans]|uniref:Uncharacterized protein n=1 Tax=Pholiota conissans TaxID=109636 RepID=A0A9P5YNF6_9AGAR|nr:hypothetical protein BDN70DRAFT_421607 [Pholiota conissans]
MACVNSISGVFYLTSQCKPYFALRAWFLVYLRPHVVCVALLPLFHYIRKRHSGVCCLTIHLCSDHRPQVES